MITEIKHKNGGWEFWHEDGEYGGWIEFDFIPDSDPGANGGFASLSTSGFVDCGREIDHFLASTPETSETLRAMATQLIKVADELDAARGAGE